MAGMKRIEIVAIEQSQAYSDRAAQRVETTDGTVLTVSRGDFVVVVSRNASGSPPLIRFRDALLPPTEETTSIEQMPPRAATIFQDPDSQIIGATVAEDVAFGPENLGLPPQVIRERVRHALRAVAMENLRDSATHLLSGSQKLRVALAGALALQPDRLLVDRATAQLDPAGRDEAMVLLRRLSREMGLTVVHLTDRMEEAASADRIIVLDDGEIALDGRPPQVLSGLAAAVDPASEPPQQAARRSGPEENRAGVSFFREMTALRYLPRESILHRSDPRTKTALALLFMTSVFLLKSFPALLLLLVVMLSLAAGAGKPLTHSLRSLKLVLYLSAVALVVNLVSMKGTPLAAHGVLQHVSREAVGVSATMLLRILLLASAASLLACTTTPLALADGLERLLKPLNRVGVRVSELAMMLMIALRFLPVIAEEAQRLVLAHSARVPDFNSGNLVRRARNCVPLLIPLFAGVARRGDALATAMDARCYRGCQARTRMNPLRFSGADFACLAAMFVLLSIAVLVESLKL